MWKSSIRGIILDQTRFSFSNKSGTDIDQVSNEVFSMLDELAWFHRVPVLILASATTVICIIQHRKYLDDLDERRRQKFIGNASKLPLWGLFRKLICSISLLHYFDQDTFSKDAKFAHLRS